nr:MAG TPA: hypothetical protein [Caudoviricetes sp.]
MTKATIQIARLKITVKIEILKRRNTKSVDNN